MQCSEQHLNERLVGFLKHMLKLLDTTEKNEESIRRFVACIFVAGVVSYYLINKRQMGAGGTQSS